MEKNLFRSKWAASPTGFDPQKHKSIGIKHACVRKMCSISPFDDQLLISKFGHKIKTSSEPNFCRIVGSIWCSRCLCQFFKFGPIRHFRFYFHHFQISVHSMFSILCSIFAQKGQNRNIKWTQVLYKMEAGIPSKGATLHHNHHLSSSY